MSFGSQLRELRDAKGWSRHQVEKFTQGVVSEDAIKALELSTDREPRNGTRAALIKLFPELGTSPQQTATNGYKYLSVSVSSLVMRH